MMRHLVLSGGPSHTFEATSAELAGLVADEFTTTIVSDIDEGFALLRAGVGGRAEPWDLVTVNALRWRMEAERYADRRAKWAYELDPADGALLVDHVRGGGGLLALHTAVVCFDAEPSWAGLLGAAWSWDRSFHPPLDVIGVDVTDAGHGHPITDGIEPFEIVDEIYGFLDEAPHLEALLTGVHGSRAHPLLWTRALGHGRLVVDLLGHGIESFTQPDHRTILHRAAMWAAAGGT